MLEFVWLLSSFFCILPASCTQRRMPVLRIVLTSLSPIEVKCVTTKRTQNRNRYLGFAQRRSK